jgi:putative glycosyltransferase (TIGR04372 family)
MVHPQVFYDWLNRPDTRFAGNMFFPNSPGHMITEIDNFLRMRHLGEIERNYNYLAVLHKGVLQIPDIIGAMFPNVFNPESGIQIWMAENEIVNLVHEIQALRTENVIDVGVSHFKVALPNDDERRRARLWHIPDLPRPYYWIVSQETNFDLSLQYYRRRAQSPDYCPLGDIPALTPELEEFLGGTPDKLALLHIRSNQRDSLSAVNAGTTTDPAVMLETIKYLKDMGYTLVKVGREPYPADWARYSVLNYTNSPLLNFRNDMLLIKAAKLVMVNASGFGNLPDVLGTPMVYYGVWHVASLVGGPKSVIVPSLMRSRRTNRLLRFSEQVQYYRDLPEYWEKKGCMGFPDDEYTERAPSSEDLLAATQEAIALGSQFVPRSIEQERFLDIDRKKFFAHIQSRISQKFLERFPEVLEAGFNE